MPAYTITELPPPSGSSLPYSEAYALNTNGSAAGNGLFPYEAVLWDGAGAALLENLPPDSIAYGINDGGDVVGTFDLEAVYPVRSFLYADGQFGLLTAVLGDEDSWAADINNDGVVIGSVGGLDTKRPFLYDSKGSGSVTLLDPLPGHAMAWAYAVNATGHVAGISANAQWEDERVFLFRNGQVEDLGLAQWVTGINEGDVLTGSRIFGGASTNTAFRLDASMRNPAFVDLGHSPARGYVGSHGNGINDEGVVVGYSFGSFADNLPFRAFAHFPPASPDTGWHDLEDLVTNAAGWTLESATAVNDKGQIVGWGTYQGAKRGFLLTPELSSTLPQKLHEYAAVFVMLFGGVESGGGGVGITPGGRPIPIPPHEWKRLSPPERDMLLGFAVKNLASVIDDPKRRDELKQAGLDLIRSAIQELEERRMG